MHFESIVLDIESITNSTFNDKAFAKTSWLHKEVGYVQIENESKELVSHNPNTGGRKVLITIEDILEDHTNSEIQDYLFSLDESRLILTLRTGKNKAYYFVDLRNTTTTKIDFDRYATDIQSLKLSPDNKKLSFIHRANIYTYDLSNQEVTQLTTDGSDKIINSTASFRFASVRNSREYQWSPDSKYIAFNQFDTEGVKSFKIINNIDSVFSTVNEIQFIKPGEMLPAVRTGIIEISKKKTTWVKVVGDPRNN